MSVSRFHERVAQCRSQAFTLRVVNLNMTVYCTLSQVQPCFIQCGFIGKI